MLWYTPPSPWSFRRRKPPSSPAGSVSVMVTVAFVGTRPAMLFGVIVYVTVPPGARLVAVCVFVTCRSGNA